MFMSNFINFFKSISKVLIEYLQVYLNVYFIILNIQLVLLKTF